MLGATHTALAMPQVVWYRHFPLRDISRVITLSGIRSVELFAGTAIVLCLAVLGWALVAVRSACVDRKR